MKPVAAMKELNPNFNTLFQFFKFPLLNGVNGDSEIAKLIWLVRLRWAALALFIFLAGPGYVSGALNSTTLVIYVGVLSLLFLFNFLTHLIFVSPRKNIGPLFICFQLALDLVVLTSLLMISGGFFNPFVGLFLLNASLGGVLIRGKYSWPFIILCHALLISLQIIFITDHLTTFDQIKSGWMSVSHVLVFATWIVMRSLGGYLENHFEDKSKMHLQNEKQDRLRALGALAAGFSHEFASPLNAAKLRLDRLERNFTQLQLAPTTLENLQEARLSIAACESVIHRMNSAQLDVRDFNLKPVDIKDFLVDVIESWKEDFPTAVVDLEINHRSVVKIPPLNFAQVIINLLDNALHAAPEKPIKINFLVSTDNYLFSVEDCGSGFASRVLERQGEPFVTTKQNGTGLGLYVSEIFVQGLNGRMILKNKPDQGAIVTLVWPNHQLAAQKELL